MESHDAGILLLKLDNGYNMGLKTYLDWIQVEMETGVGSSLTMTLDLSKDGGHTYSDTYTGNIPDVGGRLYWTRLGMTQSAFVLRLSTTSNAKVMVLGATGKFRSGVH